ncbi:MAG TPA: MFS transporter [Gaiellaceae bacterium]|nr:MFS transporter [Gaiellaceae bacterium]
MSGDDRAVGAPTGPAAALRLIRHRNFGPYFVGNATSASGTWFQNLAAALYVYERTHSPFLLGVLQFGNFVPVLLLAPWGGSAADRFDRKRLLLVTQVGSTMLSGVLAALTWAGFASVPLVIGCAVGLGISSAFSAPASQALIGDLVPRDELQSAVALNSMTFNLARAVGPTLGGISVDQLGFAPSFAINAASYLVLALGLTVVQPRARELAGRGAARLRESLRLVRQQPRLLGFLLIVTAVGFGSDPVNTEAPAFASAFALHPPRLWTGIIVGAFGAGAVAAAFLVAGRVAGSRRRMTLTLSLLGAGIVAFALSPSISLGLAFLTVAGFGYLASNTAATSRLQLDVVEHHRGRIMALWSVAFLGLRPAASLLDGALAGAFGVRTAGVVLALPAFACAAGILAGPRLARRVGDASRSAGA